MDLRTVEYFLAIAEEGSLSAAAQRLGVTQPALTKAIRRLEDETGAALFDRNARGVSLTVYGRALLRHARLLAATLRDAADEIQALRAGLTGEVRLGAGPAWHTNILPEAIRRLRQTSPRIRIKVIGGLDNVLKRELRAGGVDFVLAVTPETSTDEPDLEWQSLIADDYRIIAAATHPLRQRRTITLADTLAFPWILHGPGTTLMRKLAILFRAHGLCPPEPLIETDVVAMKLALMRRGEYLSYHGAGDLAEADPGWITPLDVEGSTWRRVAGIITRRGVVPNPLAEALIGCIRSVALENGSKVRQEPVPVERERTIIEGARP